MQHDFYKHFFLLNCRKSEYHYCVQIHNIQLTLFELNVVKKYVVFSFKITKVNPY